VSEHELGARLGRHDIPALGLAGRWEELLVRRPVRAGDFVHVPTGTVHALGPGVLVCEVQQTSDTTYRVWDFDRRDADGHVRELHLDKAKRVLKAPYDPGTTQTAGEPVDCPGGRRRSLVRGAQFEVTLHEVTGAGYRAAFPSYELLTVTDGAGSMAWDSEEYPLRAGDHVVLPADADDVAFAGQLTIVSSRPRGR
jgi:mannose-6-phosphate isomerase